MGVMRSSPIVSLNAESGIPSLATCRKNTLCQHHLHIMYLPPPHLLTTLYTNSGVNSQSPVWLPGSRQPLLVRVLGTYNMLRTPPPQSQPTRPHSPIPLWKDITIMVALYIPDLPSKNIVSTLAAALFLQLDHTRDHSHNKIYTDESHSPYLPSTAAAI